MLHDEKCLSEAELARQARLARCAEIIAALLRVPTNDEIEKIKSVIDAHAALVHELESIVNMWPDHPHVVKLVDLRDKFSDQIQVVSKLLISGLPTIK